MKLRNLFLALVLTFVLIFVTSCSCSGDDDKPCEHNYGEWQIVTKATCESTGLKKKVCSSCNDEQEEVINALGHDYGAWVSNGNGTHSKVCKNDATHKLTENCQDNVFGCDEDLICEVCNDTFGKSDDHSYSEFTSNHDGTHSKVCSKDPTHKVIENCYDSKYACGEDLVCDLCKETYGKAEDHIYDDGEITLPTCTKKGYTTYSCTNEGCNESYIDNEVDAVGHEWNQDQSCEEGHQCLNCDESEDALGHEYEFVGEDKADCENPLIKKYECSRCFDKYKDEIGSPLGHDIKDVTPKELHLEGCKYQLVYNCKTCGNECAGEIIYHHDYIASVTQEATCQEDGEKTLKCECGDTLTEKIEKNSLSHLWDEGTLNGNIRTYSCLNHGCKESKTLVDASNTTNAVVKADDLASAGGVQLENANIALDDSTLEQLKDKDLTISSDTLKGEDLSKALSTLSKEQQEQIGDNPVIYNFQIEENGNAISNFDGLVTVTLPYKLSVGEDVDSIAVWYMSEGTPVSIKATYSNGYITFETTHFSYYTITRLTPKERCALYGHSYITNVFEGTCLTDGYELSLCLRCHETVKTITSVAKGHQYSETVTPATCTKDGECLYECINCEHYYKEKLQALKHAWVEVEHVEATCNNAGYTKYYCDKCKENNIVSYPQLKHEIIGGVYLPTCEEDGYTLYHCQKCKYEYKAEIKPALGHNYEVEWTWSNDYSTVSGTLVCLYNSSHIVELDVKVEKVETNATCKEPGKVIYTATASYKDVTYKDVKEEIKEIINHTKGNEQKHDEMLHWYECSVCGEKLEDEKHIFDDGEIIKSPDCQNEGLIKYSCSCGFTKEEKLPISKEHSYVDNVCSVCGKEEIECDHKTTKFEYIDLGKLGLCGGIVAYYTCECGENVRYDESITEYECDDCFETYTEWEDEDGTLWCEETSECYDCGFKSLFIYKEQNESCIYRTEGTASFYVGDEIILENGYVYESYDDHDEEIVSIDLSEYGACGGVIYYYKCRDCGDICGYEDRKFTCATLKDIEFKEEYTNTSFKETMEGECPDCGLSVYIERKIAVENCRYIDTLDVDIKVHETEVLKIDVSDENLRHNCLEDYEIINEECKDGVLVHGVCDNCDIEYTYTTFNHNFDEEYVDLSAYSSCGLVVNTYGCAQCDYIKYINYIDKCDFEYINDKEIVDESGVKHHISYYECRYCDVSYTEDHYELVVDKCSYKSMYITTFYCDGKEILKAEDENINFEHDYEYEYQLLGSSCEDGILVSYKCKDCNQTRKDEISWHATFVVQEIELSKFGVCGGFIEIRSCPCKKEHQVNWNIDCHYDSEHKSYYDENGDYHELSTYTCQDCSLVFTIDTYDEINGCSYHRYHKYSIIVGDEKVIDDIVIDYGQYDNHNLVYEYKLLGEICEDGIEIYSYCDKCDYENTDVEYWHISYQEFILELDSLGTCGGHIHYQACPCGDKVHFEYYNHCCLENIEHSDYVDDKGITHYLTTSSCTYCSLVEISDSYRIVDGCLVENHTYLTIIVDGKTIVENIQNETYINYEHEYIYEYKLYGTSCNEGFEVFGRCQNCDEVIRETYFNHKAFYETSIELSQYTNCGGHIELYSCPCKEVKDIELYFICALELIDESYYDDERVYHEVLRRICHSCQLDLKEEVIVITNGCTVNHYRNYNLTIADNDILVDYLVLEDSYTNHTYKTKFNLLGKSCEDGVEIIEYCELCDWNRSDVYYEHMNVNSYQYDLMEFGGCGGWLDYYGCPCGEKTELHNDIFCPYEYNFEVIDIDGVPHEIETYTCPHCQLLKTVEFYYESDGCRQYKMAIYNLVIGDNVILEDVVVIFDYYYSHEYEYTYEAYGPSCFDGVYYFGNCVKCGEYTSGTYYDHRMNEGETIDLYDYGCCGGMIYFDTCVCKEFKNLHYDSYCDYAYDEYSSKTDDGLYTFVRKYTCESCGLVIECKEYTIQEECYLNTYIEYDFIVGEQVIIEDYRCLQYSDLHHDYKIEYELFGESCEDGVYYKEYCKICGDSYEQEYYHHEMLLVEHVNLSSTDSCGGEIFIYSCACGEYVQDEMYLNCSNEYHYEEYEDEDGFIHRVEAYTCEYCNLRYQKDQYTEHFEESCTTSYNTSIYVVVGAEILLDYTYSLVTESHDYQIKAELQPGSLSCEDGVLLTYTCKNCQDSYQDKKNSHYNFIKESIDLKELGAICGGKLDVKGCACGENVSVSYDYLVCDFSREYTPFWLVGDKYYKTNAYINHCIVTDPDECGFMIRQATYYLLEENSCLATKYEIYQIGYNPDDGTCGKEITIKTSATSIIHSYETIEEDGEYDNGTYHKIHTECSVCKSYETEITYTTKDDFIEKTTREFVNNNPDSNEYSVHRSEEVYEYNQFINHYGNLESYQSFHYYRSEAFNGTVYYEQEESNYDVDITPQIGYYAVRCTTRISGNEKDEMSTIYECNYVKHIINGYERIYSYVTYEYLENLTYGTWEERTYTYNFDEPCVRTIHYTNSSGEDCTYDDEIHLSSYKTEKEPTCTQDGLNVEFCSVCSKVLHTEITLPYQHSWYHTENGYFKCSICELESIHGLNGEMILEDFTSKYGNSEKYVVGYYDAFMPQYTYYVSLYIPTNADGLEEEIILPEVEIYASEDLRAYEFSKQQVKDLASELGYQEGTYLVRFAVVPYGADSTLDYAITFE